MLRTYFACTGRGQGGPHVDALIGLEGFFTRQAHRLICFAGGQLPFARAARMLAECRGWAVSDEAIRRTCQAQARRIDDFTATPAACRGSPKPPARWSSNSMPQR